MTVNEWMDTNYDDIFSLGLSLSFLVFGCLQINSLSSEKKFGVWLATGDSVCPEFCDGLTTGTISNTCIFVSITFL
jgi:hypothetical protein